MKYFYILLISFFICSCTKSTDEKTKINTNHAVKFSYNLGVLSVDQEAPCLTQNDYISIHDRIFDAMSEKDELLIINRDIESDVELIIQCPSKNVVEVVNFISGASN
jgi:hypothetical protein